MPHMESRAAARYGVMSREHTQPFQDYVIGGPKAPIMAAQWNRLPPEPFPLGLRSSGLDLSSGPSACCPYWLERQPLAVGFLMTKPRHTATTYHVSNSTPIRDQRASDALARY